MRTVVASISILIFGVGANACTLSLEGTWKSDREMSMAFARDNSKLEAKTDAFLTALLGHMTMKFQAGEVQVVMPDIQVPVSGQLRPFAGYAERKPFSVLLCNGFSVVWSARRPSDGEMVATTFNVVDRDTVWVYTGGTDPKVPDLHIREYFRRVR